MRYVYTKDDLLMKGFTNVGSAPMLINDRDNNSRDSSHKTSAIIFLTILNNYFKKSVQRIVFNCVEMQVLWSLYKLGVAKLVV